jgi:hypothetical protein
MAIGLTEDARFPKFESIYMREMIRAMESRDRETAYNNRE